MSRYIKYSLCFFIICAILTIQSCNKKEEHIIFKEKVSGLVQKGPFINGTAVTMSELTSALDQTGKVFTTQIINNYGSFEINKVSLTSSFVEFSANGFYFDEIKGAISDAPISLYSVADVTETSSINVNILTHLEKSRIKNLVDKGEVFSHAKAIAQSEILSFFGFSNDIMSNSETLDISENTEANAILLSISIILQANRSVGELTELLASLSNIFQDGILGDSIYLAQFRQPVIDLDLATIRINLEDRYHKLGLNAEIPDFEKYINDFLIFTGKQASITIKPISQYKTTSITLNAVVNANSLNTTVLFEFGLTSDYGNTIDAEPKFVSGLNETAISVQITGLSPGTRYHYRVRATNARSTAISEDCIFETIGPVIDNDGNVYQTIGIGSQVWITENLKTTKFNDNSPIPNITAKSDWNSLSTPAYCWYNNDYISNGNRFGALYNWYALNTNRLCPIGWHVPSSDEMDSLFLFLHANGSLSIPWVELLDSDTLLWRPPPLPTNKTGFTARPGGERNIGDFLGLLVFGYWWTSTSVNLIDATFFWMYNQGSGGGIDDGSKKGGKSIRCLRN